MFSCHISSRILSEKDKNTGFTVNTFKEENSLVEFESISDFAAIISDGHPWTQAVFKTGFKDKSNIISQQIFAFDFDNGCCLPKQQLLSDLYNKTGITPSIIYDTFSSKPERERFRVVYVLDKPIGPDESSLVCDVMKTMMDDISVDAIDRAINSASHFIPGNNVTVVSDVPICFVDFLNMIIAHIGDTCRNKYSLTRKVQQNTPLYIYSIGPGEKLHFLPSEISGVSTKQLKKIPISGLQQQLHSEIRVFRDFMNGVQLKHMEIFGLACNLHWINGGAKLMQDIMHQYNANGVTKYSKGEMNAVKIAKAAGYYPMHLKKFSPHKEDHAKGNIITAIFCPYGKVEVHTSLPKQEKLEVVYEEFMSKYRQTMISQDTDIHIFKVQTGFGKTHTLIGPSTSNTLLAFPTHDLKDEFSGDLKTAGYEHLSTPDIPTFNCPFFNKKVEACWKRGTPQSVGYYLNRAFDMSTECEKDKILADKFIESLKTAKDSDCRVLTTHHRAIHETFKHDTIIFDEDPFSSILETDCIRISMLKNIIADLSDRIEHIRSRKVDDLDDYEDRASLLENLEQLLARLMTVKEISNYEKLQPVTISNQAFNRVDGDNRAKIRSLASSENFLVDGDNIFMSRHNRLPDGKQIIIMSATIDCDVYKSLYGDRVKVYDFSAVETKGKIIQKTKKSFHRESVEDDFTALSRELKINTNMPSITYKKLKTKVPNADEIAHFGKCSGYNHLKGVDINIIGTPHKPSGFFKVIGMAIGYNVDCELKNRIVKDDHFSFRFRTFDDDKMSRLQINIIRGDIMQAIGRARILREDCTVYVYSNLPIMYAEIN